ncbi:MAG: hypothetical protein ACXQS4_05135 [Methermicoccaceae archaeon]
MVNNYESITDARTAVYNSGVSDWDWGTDRDGTERNSDEVLEKLAQFLRATDAELSDATLALFVRAVLGDNPEDYDLGGECNDGNGR